MCAIRTNCSMPVGFPTDTLVRRDSGALRLFELGQTEFTWQEFQDALEPRFRECLDQSFWPAVHQACARSVRNPSDRPDSRCSAFTVGRAPLHADAEPDGDHWRRQCDVLHHLRSGRRRYAGRGAPQERCAGFHRTESGPSLSLGIIDRYSDVDRLREFVEHQATTLGRSGKGANNGRGLGAIWEAIRLLETESLNRGVYDEAALPVDFGPAGEARVPGRFPLWHEKRALLERAATDGDVVTVSRVLSELDPINVEFIDLASRRLGELARADARDS
jgi:hypothetical protein